MLEVVGNIEKITFKYNDESQLTEVKNTCKQKNPEMIRIHNNNEVVFYKTSIDDCNIEKQLKNIILSLLTNKMKDDILETIVIGLNIQRKQLSVTTTLNSAKRSSNVMKIYKQFLRCCPKLPEHRLMHVQM
jgi:hypothetical protein